LFFVDWSLLRGLKFQAFSSGYLDRASVGGNCMFLVFCLLELGFCFGCVGSVWVCVWFGLILAGLVVLSLSVRPLVDSDSKLV